MGTVGVVVGDPLVKLTLGVGEIREDLAPEEFCAKAAVETLDLARRGRRARCRETVGDAVLPADLVEDPSKALPERRAENTRPLSVRISSGTPWSSRADAKIAQTLREIARFISPADTQ